MSNMVVQTNVLALNSHRNMKLTGVVQSRASARLASGYRINTAADDAAGLAISEKMRSQIRGLDMASKNALDGQALVQTAEGGLQEIDNMLQRIRELLVQASNDTNDQTSDNPGGGDRSKLQAEIDQLVTEIDSMADRVEFNKKTLLNGTYSNNAQMTKVLTDNYKAAYAKLNDYSTAAQIAAYSTGTLAGLSGSKWTAAYDKYLLTSNTRVALSEHVGRLSDAIGNAATGSALYFQLGANANQGINTNINKIKSDVLAIGEGNGISKIKILEQTGAQTITGWISTLDTALTMVTDERAKLGAISNRLDYTVKSLDVSSENLSDSESRIRDADMAKEMMAYTKTNVLQQAAISMLSQANQLPQNLLQLLR